MNFILYYYLSLSRINYSDRISYFISLLSYFYSVPAQISVVTSGSEVVMEGGTESFYCDASAYPEPIVSWSKVNADGLTVILVSSWLNFTNIGRDKAGDYICIANNTCGKRKSSRRTIDVQCKLQCA